MLQLEASQEYVRTSLRQADALGFDNRTHNLNLMMAVKSMDTMNKRMIVAQLHDQECAFAVALYFYDDELSVLIRPERTNESEDNQISLGHVSNADVLKFLAEVDSCGSLKVSYNGEVVYDGSKDIGYKGE